VIAAQGEDEHPGEACANAPLEATTRGLATHLHARDARAMSCKQLRPALGLDRCR
jgi:hypothetical protein